MDRKYDRSLVKACLFYIPGFLFLGAGVFFPLGRLFVDTGITPLAAVRMVFDNPWLLHVLVFTLVQGLLSALLSCIIALPFSALFRFFDFPGKAALLSLSRLVFSLPAVVIAFAFILIYGNQGWLNQLLRPFSLDGQFLYRPGAVIFAHIYFNVFYGVCCLKLQWDTVPGQVYRTASLLNLGVFQTFRHCDWPYLRFALVRFFIQTFLLCLGSYAIPLLLGGGPSSSTLELAIWQALRVEFSVDQAVAIAVLQLIISGGTALICLLLLPAAGDSSLKSGEFYKPPEKKLTGLMRILPLAYGLFLILPIAGVLREGSASFWQGEWPDKGLMLYAIKGLGCSLYWAGVSAGGAVLVAGTFALAQWHSSYHLPFVARAGELFFQLKMGVSPMVLSLGIFMSWHREFQEVMTSSLGVITVFTLMALPYCWWQIFPALRLVRQNSWRQKSLLGLGCLQALWQVDLPALKRPLSASFLTGLSLALGNLSVVSLFAPEGMHSLASGVSDLMSVYRFQDAALLAAILALLALVIFYLSDRILEKEVGS